jgi:putative thiamine transport system ATP-binding protein
MDEPFSRLDARLRQEIRELTFSLVRKSGLPAILVTHDRADADATAGRIIDLDE